MIQLFYPPLVADPKGNSPETRWLLLIHQIPPKPNYLRVKIGRRLQRLGAAAIKNSVYVLPRTDQGYEDFQWVTREITESGGEASVCEARFVDGLSDDQIEGLFNTAREGDYREISEEARRLRASLKGRKKPDEELRSRVEATVTRLRKRLADIVALDFFSANGGQATEALLSSLEQQLQESASTAPSTLEEPATAPEQVHGRTWVTRKGIHVDRMASAWLIQRFIDPDARFKFVPGRGHRPEPGEFHFDMFEAEYTHEGDRCTFEVLCARFALPDPGLIAIAEIVHDIDLKDEKFGRPEVDGIVAVLRGIREAASDDDARIQLATSVFDGLHAQFGGRR
jgi:hypothetical protein